MSHGLVRNPEGAGFPFRVEAKRIVERWNGSACDCRFQFLSADCARPDWSAQPSRLTLQTDSRLPGAEEVRNANWIEVAPQKTVADL
jgi:hypothetical protein